MKTTPKSGTQKQTFAPVTASGKASAKAATNAKPSTAAKLKSAKAKVAKAKTTKVKMTQTAMTTVKATPSARTRFMQIRHAATLLGVHENTVRKWIDRGYLRATRLPSGTRRLLTEDVMRLAPQINGVPNQFPEFDRQTAPVQQAEMDSSAQLP